MYSTLNKILYNNDKSSVTEETLVTLDAFVMTQNKKEQWLATLNTRIEACKEAPKAPMNIPTSTLDTPIAVTEKETIRAASVKTDTSEWFTPTQENTLFWSLFISVYGYTDYLNIAHKYHNAEIEEKQAVVEKLGKTPRRLKETNHRITNQSIQELLSGVMVNKHDTLFSLIAYSVYYERQIVVLFENRTYIRFRPETETTSQAIFVQCRIGQRRNIYSVYLETNTDKMTEIREQWLELESYLKPLKGVSSYKMPELEEIANKIGLECSANIKRKKGELYDKIAEKCSLEKVHANER